MKLLETKLSKKNKFVDTKRALLLRFDSIKKDKNGVELIVFNALNIPQKVIKKKIYKKFVDNLIRIKNSEINVMYYTAIFNDLVNKEEILCF